jgi:UDP-N-acetylmuramyl tripeptide synthase
LNEKQSTASRNQNNAFSELQVASQKWQNIGSIVNNGTNGITGCVQAQYQQNQGAAQGAQSLASTNSQMAQNMLSNTSQGIGKFYDMQLQDLQLLQQIAANSQVRS